LLTYTLNMLTKKIEIVLLLAIGLVLTGHPVMTPALMVLMLVTNDFLSMSLTADRASPGPRPSAWRMRRITAAGLVLGVGKLAFSTAMVSLGWFRLGLGVEALQTWTFATLVFGNQALLYVLRERRRMWRSKPSAWVVASSVADIAIVVVLAVSGILMTSLPWRLVLVAFGAAAGFALLLDQVKVPILSALDVE
jgi:H+-transporting ATPase